MHLPWGQISGSRHSSLSGGGRQRQTGGVREELINKKHLVKIILPLASM